MNDLGIPKDYALLIMGAAFGFLLGWLTGRWRGSANTTVTTQNLSSQELKLSVNGKTISLDADAAARVQSLIQKKNMIDAIKVLREATGLPLAEAKAVADSLAKMLS